jgi:hypothetical protein
MLVNDVKGSGKANGHADKTTLLKRSLDKNSLNCVYFNIHTLNTD